MAGEFKARNRASAFTAVLMLVAAQVVVGGSWDLSWYSFDGGGGTSRDTGRVYELSGTIGQPDAGSFVSPMTGGGFELVGGLWTAGACTTGNFNLTDYAEFARCRSGPATAVDAGCDCFDFDADGDVDLRDFAVLQVNFSGS